MFLHIREGLFSTGRCSCLSLPVTGTFQRYLLPVHHTVAWSPLNCPGYPQYPMVRKLQDLVGEQCAHERKNQKPHLDCTASSVPSLPIPMSQVGQAFWEPSAVDKRAVDNSVLGHIGLCTQCPL